MEKERNLNDVVENFFDVYSIEFKKNNVEIPHFIQLEFGTESEYDDEGGTYRYKVVSNIHFFDKQKNRYTIDFEVEQNDWDYPVEELLIGNIHELYSVESLMRNYGSQMIETKRGA